MANKGKRETKKQITEVKQEIQKDLDKMGRVRSNISTQQTEEPSTKRKKTIVPTEEVTLTKSMPKISTEEQPKRKTDITNVGRPKGSKDKQKRKTIMPKGAIEEAQEKMQKRKEKLNSYKPVSSKKKSDIDKRDKEYKDKINQDEEYRELVREGRRIEQAIIDDVNMARRFFPQNFVNQDWVLYHLEKAKQEEGEKNFYRRLNENAEILQETAHTIAWESNPNVDVKSEMSVFYTLLFGLTFEEQKEMYSSMENDSTDNFVEVTDETDIPFI